MDLLSLQSKNPKKLIFKDQYSRKRRWSPIINPSPTNQINQFNLLQPPHSYALTEMFDDCASEAEIRNEKNFDYYENECETPPNYFEF